MISRIKSALLLIFLFFILSCSQNLIPNIISDECREIALNHNIDDIHSCEEYEFSLDSSKIKLYSIHWEGYTGI